MKTRILTAVSAVAILAAAPAFADNVKAEAGATSQTSNERTVNQDKVPTVTEKDIERGWENTKETVSDAADSVAQGAEDAYESIKAALIDEDMDEAEIEYITVDTRNTAQGMIGSTVRNGADEDVADVEDIILNADGEAMMIVVADGGFLGLGEKKAAFQYDAMTRQNNEGDVIMPLTEANIENAAEFSYEADNQGENVRVIPTGGYSAKELLKAKLIDGNGDELATVQDITMGEGEADNVIVAFNQVLGLGGERAAFDFDDLTLTRTDAGVQFQLSAEQTSQFEAYKQAVKNN